MKKNHLDIYTDASFNCQKKVAAYAFYAILNGKHVSYANSVTCTVESARDAEMLAVGHAFNFLLGEDIPKLVGITVHIDCSSAIAAISKQEQGLGMIVNRLWQRLITKTNSPKNSLEHIKAHSDRQGTRYVLNRWCDRHARIELRKITNAARGVQEQVGDIPECNKSKL